MIKDSKIIGTKIDAPFGWKTFKVGELFDKQGPITDRSVADFSIPYSEAYRGVDYINCATAGVDNNGCPMIVSRDVVEKSYIINNCITVSGNGVNTGSVFVQTEDFCVLQDSYALVFKCVDVDVDDYLFVSSLIFKYHDVFDYQVKATWTRLSELSIELPITSDNQPDFEWMSAYIKVVKADYLEQKELSNKNEIKAYLSAGNTDSTDITDDDRQFLRDFEKLPRRKFKVGDLFDVCTTTGFDAGKLVFTDNGVPFIGRTDSNYGIQGYLHNMPDSKPNPSNVISISQIGSQSAQYRKTVWYASQNMFYVELLNHDLTLDSGLFFVGIFNKILQKYLGYTSYPTKNSIFNWIIELPVVDSSQVDVQSIEKYMQIQSKPLIDEVAEALVPVGGGALLVDIPSIERYMQIQIKFTIAKRQQLLDQRLQLAKTM